MIPVLIGLGVLIGGAVIVANWDSIKNWLKDFIPKLKEAWASIRVVVPHGARIYGDLFVEGADKLSKIMHKLYYKEDGHWCEETTTRIVDESEVPAAILSKIKRQEEDITEEMEDILDLEV